MKKFKWILWILVVAILTTLSEGMMIPNVQAALFFDDEESINRKIAERLADDSEVDVETLYPGITEWIPIYTPEQLQLVGSGETVLIEQEGNKEYIFEFGSTTGYLVKNDLDMTGISFSPISGLMTGVFCGNNKTISNLTIYSDGSEVYQNGLFQYIDENGIVSYVKLINTNITVANSRHNFYTTGSIAGHSSGTISNCINVGDVSADVRWTGGIVGFTQGGFINDCYNVGTVSGQNVGGITSRTDAHKATMRQSEIRDCINTATITGEVAAGGIASHAEYLVKDCYNIGDVIANEEAGGIVAQYTRSGYGAKEDNALIENCFNLGNISNLTDGYVGGIVGVTKSETSKFEIRACFNGGVISGYGEVGGIAGNGMDVYDCYNKGTVQGSGFIGGLAGSVVSLSNGYNVGEVSGDGVVRGLVGGNSSGAEINIDNCYYLSGIISDDYGTEVSAQELKNLAGQLGQEWKQDTSNINQGYPILYWQYSEPVEVPDTYTVTIITHYVDGIQEDEINDYSVISGDSFEQTYDMLEGYELVGTVVYSYPSIDINNQTVAIPSVEQDYTIVLKFDRKEHQVTISVEYPEGTAENQVFSYNVLYADSFEEHFEIEAGYRISGMQIEKGVDIDFRTQTVKIDSVTKDMFVTIFCAK